MWAAGCGGYKGGGERQLGGGVDLGRRSPPRTRAATALVGTPVPTRREAAAGGWAGLLGSALGPVGRGVSFFKQYRCN